MASNGTNSEGQDGAQPQSMAEVERLVQRLYQPGSPGEISRIEASLQELQRSQQGWQLADQFLQSSDHQVRFFGALTFTTKINRDWDSLSDEDAEQLLYRLIEWLIRLIDAGESKLVIKKLCSSLVSYYLRPSGPWQNCIRHLILSLNQRKVIHSDALDQGPPTTTILPSLSPPSMLAVLWFASYLVEEVNKASKTSITTHKYYERVSSNVDDVVALIGYAITLTPRRDPNINKDGISCFHDWLGFTQGAWISKAMEPGPLRQLTPLAIVALRQDETFEVAVDLFIDILGNFSAFLTADDFESLSTLLTTTRIEEVISRLNGGDFDNETLSIAGLLTAYGDATVQDLAMGPEDPKRNQILLHLISLLRCAGYPIIDDEICSQAVEFWMTYTEFLTDSLFEMDRESPVPAYMYTAQQLVTKVLEACFLKIQMPPHEITVAWDSDDKVKWRGFRADVEDLIQGSYTLLGVEILGKFVQTALEALERRAWIQLEAMLFCLNALSDLIAEKELIDQMLSTLFASSLFVDLSSTTEQIPKKARQTACEMIGRYTAWIERHGEYLPVMLNFLFEFLREDPSATMAAKVIESTCSSCRKTLVTELGAFLQQYEALLNWNTTDAYTMQKVIGGIAAIIQAVPTTTEEEKVEPLSLLIRSVERDVNVCVDAMKIATEEGTETEHAVVIATHAMRCLSSMGKGLQIPDDEPVDLDADVSIQSQFWREGNGAKLQERVLHILQTLSALMKWHGDIIEAICEILRTGYKESTLGLFVFRPVVTVNFVLSCTTKTPRLDYVLETARAMLSRQSQESELDLRYAASSFLDHFIGLIDTMSKDPSSDPEVASSGIALANKMIPRYLTCMIRVPNIEKQFDFALKSLQAPEIMPKRAAADFWASFVQRHELSDEDTTIVQTAMQQYGPLLCRILVRQISGEAARSEMNMLAEPLKKLVFHQPRAKQWLSEALDSDSFPSTKVGPTEKRVWLQKIMHSRGSKGTNQAVMDFWIACRGAEFAYAS